MGPELTTLEVGTLREWRTWLAKHHASSPGVWLVYYKDHRRVESIDYDDSVREALCFGWVDSLIKRLDDGRVVIIGPIEAFDLHHIVGVGRSGTNDVYGVIREPAGDRARPRAQQACPGTAS